MNDIEAIALALCLADDPDQIGTTGSCEGGCVHPAVGSVCPYREQARAAYLETLRQIREPGRGALCAAATHDGWLPVTDESAHIIRMEDIKYDWQAMIDHLIAEAESE